MASDNNIEILVGEMRDSKDIRGRYEIFMQSSIMKRIMSDSRSLPLCVRRKGEWNNVYIPTAKKITADGLLLLATIDKEDMLARAREKDYIRLLVRDRRYEEIVQTDFTLMNMNSEGKYSQMGVGLYRKPDQIVLYPQDMTREGFIRAVKLNLTVRVRAILQKAAWFLKDGDVIDELAKLDLTEEMQFTLGRDVMRGIAQQRRVGQEVMAS